MIFKSVGSREEVDKKEPEDGNALELFPHFKEFQDACYALIKANMTQELKVALKDSPIGITEGGDDDMELEVHPERINDDGLRGLTVILNDLLHRLSEKLSPPEASPTQPHEEKPSSSFSSSDSSGSSSTSDSDSDSDSDKQ